MKEPRKPTLTGGLTRRQLGLGAGAVGLTALAASFPSAAQAYPSRPLRWIVPYAAGGGADVTARLYGAQMEKILGQPVVTDNKPGASTIIGVNALLAAPADGYTIMACTDALAVNPYLLDKVPYTLNDFVGISVAIKGALALVSRPDYPAKTAAEALNHIKANNGKLSYGTWGIGSGSHLAMETLLDRMAATMVHVPFAGAAPAINAMLGGQMDIMLADLATAGQFIKAGRLKLWAVGSKERHPSFPETPTIAESGYPGFDWFNWIGVIARKGTPPEALARLHAAIVATGNNPDFSREQLTRGNIPWNSTPRELDELLAANAVAAKSIIEKRGIKVN